MGSVCFFIAAGAIPLGASAIAYAHPGRGLTPAFHLLPTLWAWVDAMRGSMNYMGMPMYEIRPGGHMKARHAAHELPPVGGMQAALCAAGPA